MAGNKSLNTVLRLEPILVSLTIDNYKSLLSILLDSLKLYDTSVYEKLSRFNWLIESQLGKMPSRVTLKTEFPDLMFDNVEVITDMDELTDFVYMYINQKKQQHISSKLLNYADVIRSQGLSNEMIDDIYKSISLVESDTDYVSVVDSFSQMYEEQVKVGGIPFLCPTIDKLTGGISEGELCTILGASGSMKTTYSSNIAFNAIKEGKNVLYLSLEEQPLQLYCKWLSRASVDIGRPLEAQAIIHHELNDKDKAILMNDVEPYFKGLAGNLYIVGEQEIGDYSMTSFEAKFKEIDKLAKEQTGHGVDLLVIDHIQLIKFAVTNMDPTTVINMYVSFFRQQCLSWLHEDRSIAIILLSQANRDGTNYASKHDGMYLATHVAEASEIIRASSYIISVYTDATLQNSKLLKVGCVKLRGAQLPLSTINVFADGSVYQVGDTDVVAADYSMNDLMDVNIENKKDFTEEAMMASGVLNGLE